jgi:hypothetical protein
MTREEIFGEGFGAFKLRRASVGPKIFSPAARNARQRQLPAALWANDGQSIFSLRKAQQRRNIVTPIAVLQRAGSSAVPALPGRQRHINLR